MEAIQREAEPTSAQGVRDRAMLERLYSTGLLPTVCGITNWANNPHACGYCSNGSNERRRAEEYYGRVSYRWWRVTDGVLITLGAWSALIACGGPTAGAYPWAALIPAGVCGVVSFAAVIWRGYRMREPISDILKSLRELWDLIGRTPF